MKILLLELNSSETCARKPSRYGGSGRTLRCLAENIDNCYLAAEESCFEGDINEKCICLKRNDIESIKNGTNLYYLLGNCDLFVYANPLLVLNTEKPQLCWSVGANENINPNIKNLLLHNPKWQSPRIQSPNTKVHEFVLGIDIPPFEEYKKSIDVFQCSNHYSAINSHWVANWCVKHKIKGVFAGPIDINYKQTFLNEIDYNYATYIGQIDEDEKIRLMKMARCYTSIIAYPINGPQLSIKQAWSYNCIIVSTEMGIMPEVVKHGENGFIIHSEDEFVDAVKAHSWEINQKDCWGASLRWSAPRMVESFKKVVEGVVKEN